MLLRLCGAISLLPLVYRCMQRVVSSFLVRCSVLQDSLPLVAPKSCVGITVAPRGRLRRSARAKWDDAHSRSGTPHPGQSRAPRAISAPELRILYMTTGTGTLLHRIDSHRSGESMHPPLLACCLVVCVFVMCEFMAALVAWNRWIAEAKSRDWYASACCSRGLRMLQFCTSVWSVSHALCCCGQAMRFRAYLYRGGAREGRMVRGMRDHCPPGWWQRWSAFASS